MEKFAKIVQKFPIPPKSNATHDAHDILCLAGNIVRGKIVGASLNLEAARVLQILPDLKGNKCDLVYRYSFRDLFESLETAFDPVSVVLYLHVAELLTELLKHGIVEGGQGEIHYFRLLRNAQAHNNIDATSWQFAYGKERRLKYLAVTVATENGEEKEKLHRAPTEGLKARDAPAPGHLFLWNESKGKCKCNFGVYINSHIYHRGLQIIVDLVLNVMGKMMDERDWDVNKALKLLHEGNQDWDVGKTLELPNKGDPFEKCVKEIENLKDEVQSK